MRIMPFFELLVATWLLFFGVQNTTANLTLKRRSTSSQCVSRSTFSSQTIWTLVLCSASPHGPDRLQASYSNALQCSELSAVLKSKVSYPASISYAQSLAGYFSEQEAQLTPECIVLPTESNDVATAIKILSAANLANRNSCQFAIKSGGHTPFAGSANINSGITIDLAGLNEITVSDDQTILTLGAGQRWGAVYEKIVPRGLMVVGGKSAVVGVGGITTGGES